MITLSRLAHLDIHVVRAIGLPEGSRRQLIDYLVSQVGRSYDLQHVVDLGRLVLFAYTWILMHHMLGGIRHFIWDFGHGLDRERRMWLARGTLIGSVILTVLIWAFALTLR